MNFVKNTIKQIFGKKLIHKIEEYVCSSNLSKLAQIYNSDKYGRHLYTPIYERVFHSLRHKKLNILEIGVGGYDRPTEGGASLKMWKRYFPKSNIYAIDIFDKSKLQENRIKIFQGSQDDIVFLEKVVQQTGVLDIIIDDGSHINKHVISSFNFLFPKLKNGGIYVIEDLETAYRDDMGGDSNDLNNSSTSMNFFKTIVDAVNYHEFNNNLYEHIEFVDKIESIHFYHNLIFIFKK
ncbi:MAG: hypothetical protein A2033_07790 [Bacteroidetes bacterium GWA2_31_9]|nr:MAG: hypothetical protein A2033_07790 [Bacteroidetes bacterium GWA2_31_9]